MSQNNVGHSNSGAVGSRARAQQHSDGAPLLKITLIRSTIGAIPKHKDTIKALGLRKINSSAIQKDNEAIRGMTRQVRHLVRVEPVKGDA